MHNAAELAMATILHITQRQQWEAAQRSGAYEAPSLARQGFIHCSLPEQVIGVADFLFRGQYGLVLLCIDASRVKPEVRYENLKGGSRMFPHIYGPLNLDAVVNVHEFPPRADGSFALPEALASGVAALNRGTDHRRIAPVVLIGGSGMLGRAFCQLLDRTASQVEFLAPPRAELDITDAGSVNEYVYAGHTMLINCAGWTDVDGAEARPDAADTLNGKAVGRLAQRCAEVRATLVHFSTDYVFDGASSEPYSSSAPRNPVSAYGRSKALGESLIEASGCRHLIIRTSWLYAPWGKNFVRTIAKAARERPSLKVVSDQRGRPTSAEHLAQASLSLLERNAQGTFHVTDGGECTWYEFACEIVRRVNPACRVQPCTTDEFPRPAKRPAYSVLDISESEKLLGPMPHWRDNLASVLRRLEA